MPGRPFLSSLLCIGSLACSSPESPVASGAAGQAGRAGSNAGNGSAAGGSTASGSAASGSAASPADIGGAGSGGSGGTEGGAAGTGGTGTVAGTGTGGAAGGARTDGNFCTSRPELSFCEDFEAHPVGAAKVVGPWSTAVNGEGATLEIDDTVAHSGKSSLKVRAGGFNAFYVLDVARAAKTVPSALHVRVYVRIAEPMATGHNTYIVADTVAAPGAGNAFKLGEMNAMLMYNVGGDAHAALANDGYYTDHLPGAALAANAWSCLELVLDHAKPEISVSLDGVAIPDMHHTDFPLDAYDSLRFGFEKYAGPMRDIWYDDIALGTAPLGCKNGGASGDVSDRDWLQ